MLSFEYLSPYYGKSLCTSYFGGSVSFLYLLSISTSAIMMYSTRSAFLSVYIAMLPRKSTTTNAMLYTASVSPVNAPILP